MNKIIVGAKVDARAAPIKKFSGFSRMSVNLNLLCFDALLLDNL